MLAWTLGSIHGQMTSGVAYQHLSWKAYLIGCRRAWHAIIALRKHTRSDNVGCGMPSLPFERIHCQTTSRVACNHLTLKAHMVRQRQARLAIISLGQHKRLDYVGHGMPSLSLGSIHGRTTSIVACHHGHWEAQTVERC